MEVSIRLALPPSENHLYQPIVRGRSLAVIEREEYTTWKALAELDMFQQNVPRQIVDGAPLEIEITYHFPNRSYDLDNFDKGIIDAIARRMGFNDNRIVRVVLTKNIDRRHPRVEVIVRVLCQTSTRTRAKPASPSRSQGD